MVFRFLLFFVFLSFLFLLVVPKGTFVFLGGTKKTLWDLIELIVLTLYLAHMCIKVGPYMVFLIPILYWLIFLNTILTNTILTNTILTNTILTNTIPIKMCNLKYWVNAICMNIYSFNNFKHKPK